MKFSFKLRVACVLLLVATFAISRADFTWNQAQGPPTQKDGNCVVQGNCVTDGCNPDNVSVVPDGGTTSVLVKSWEKKEVTAHGLCNTGDGLCYTYPNVQCAVLWIYGVEDCDQDFRWGTRAIYTLFSGCGP